MDLYTEMERRITNLMHKSKAQGVADFREILIGAFEHQPDDAVWDRDAIIEVILNSGNKVENAYLGKMVP